MLALRVLSLTLTPVSLTDPSAAAHKINNRRFNPEPQHLEFICFLARNVIYTSCAYATMSVSVCLSVTEEHWRIVANLGFKFRSQFTAHCGRRAALCAACGRIISHHASHCYALLL